MQALTLWQPWASAIAAGAKQIENRSWSPPARVMGQRILIHAGKKWDGARAGDVLRAWYAERRENPDVGAYPDMGRGLPFMALLCTARVRGVLTQTSGPGERLAVTPTMWADGELTDLDHLAARINRGDETAARWFLGPVGWVLGDVLPFPTPIQCPGMQGLWTPTEDIQMDCLQQAQIARIGAGPRKLVPIAECTHTWHDDDELGPCPGCGQIVSPNRRPRKATE